MSVGPSLLSNVKCRRAHRRIARAASLLACLALTVGCKTSPDAKIAAAQLTATAASLSSYYAAMHTIALESDQLNVLDQGVDGVPYDSQMRAQILDAAAELQKRADMARNIADLAASFTKLAGTTAPADATAAATKLTAECASFKPMSAAFTAPMKDALNTATGAIVTAIQEHKEREAARNISDFLSAFTKLFNAEEGALDSINDQYVGLSQALAGKLVRTGQTDASAYTTGMVKLALAPYGFTPKLSDTALQTSIAATAQMQIDQKSADLKAAQIEAGKAMEDSLADMSARIADLAQNKRLPATAPPPTLGIVNQWTTTVGK